MEIQDDRTPEQRKTHRFGICMTDSFMSGWGRADGGVSYAVWAFADIKDEYEVDRWVRSRGDAKRVRTVCLDNYRPRGRGHCHIYVAGETQGGCRTLQAQGLRHSCVPRRGLLMRQPRRRPAALRSARPAQALPQALTAHLLGEWRLSHDPLPLRPPRPPLPRLREVEALVWAEKVSGATTMTCFYPQDGTARSLALAYRAWILYKPCYAGKKRKAMLSILADL